MIPFSSLESFKRESIRNRSFSDCLYSASTFAFADAGRVSSIRSSLYNSRFAIGVFVWWEMSAINEPIDFYHGEKVGVGLCVATAVYKKAEQKLRAGGYQVKDHMELETEFIKANITSPVLQEEILKENTPNLMADITGNMLKEKEADILTILADLPDAQTMIGWMKKVHGLTTMQELTLDEALKTTTQRLSPYVRQRLTFMRLLKFYDFYDEITEG